MNHLDLSRFPALRSLTFYVVFDTLDSTCVVRAWTGILAAVRTIPRISHLEHFTLCSPASQAIMRSGSALFHALEQPLYSLDRCLAALVDRAPLRVVTLVPPQGEEFISSDWIRARSFFSALWDYDMLAF
ncbi:uncharacterized protein PHACADRAFT_246583 [Phanerochaete carnosa HHB-10118-sp]|uniref:Uncharacterized protein n=1 Tax=Phanerochaete carnosa (strain HHB-10118-sp) TaxID=650164 RepID=K5XC47_PHACS|nr:uncharacterized protein PHACADRAFT_246583 [Phanerochaete carnosa HHB-10118-sp]EKM60562.1 hypothetical protein PHACADRAFT_246583 [Phanerochaete carnosa HHB-10118-sp]